MERINVILPLSTLRLLDKRLQRYKRSQFLDYAARAMLERTAGRRKAAQEYEALARELVSERVPPREKIDG